MAATKKSAKRNAPKKGSAKRQSTKKKKSKAAAPKATQLKRQARKGLKAARGGIGKTWETLKSTTAQVVEGVKETFGP
jgi:hypothetical protein